ncbi:MAG: hypothetical protein K2M60_02240 [Lachnospiraceae bacterium]|nr:hypothetical protein [Lachnospiraceae bacterium]MDE6252577.1 hypothetical protein [Lachnospiraceae bacterium]
MKRIHPYAIFKDIIKLVYFSCCIVLFVIFFNYNVIIVAQEDFNIVPEKNFQMIFVIFIILLFLLVVSEVTSAVSGRNSRWYYTDNTICSFTMENIQNIPVYRKNDAIKFIAKRSNINKDIIEKVLSLDEDYMRSIRIIEEIE